MTQLCSRCGTQIIDAAGPCPGCLWTEEADLLLADRWRLHEEIGRGATGTVYRAIDTTNDRQVAVKILADDLIDDDASRQRFRREAAALERLDNPHIIAIYDHGVWQDVPYLVMELVDGAPLSASMPLSIDSVLDIGIQICSALAYAHGRDIVHRDLKPANILIDSAGQVKIADFGIARLIETNETGWTVTSADQTSGTPHYMAPEALEGSSIDPRSDIYSVGVVLYEASEGKLPIGRSAPAPWPLEPILNTAMQPEAEQRYSSIREMERDLRKNATDNANPGLPPDERVWLRSVAVLLALATAAAIWAVMVSLTPRILAVAEISPLTMFPPRQLPDGRFVSMARFETLPILGAAAMIAIGLAGYGLLRQHWRRNGLDRPNSTSSLDARYLVGIGAGLMLLYFGGRLIEPFGYRVSTYIPVIAGILEFGVVFLFWDHALECIRTSRPIGKETTLWLGVGLAVLPPCVEFFTYVTNWSH